MFSSLDHVIRGGLKYTISLPSVRRLKIRFQIVDISHRFGEMGEKVGKSRSLG